MEKSTTPRRFPVRRLYVVTAVVALAAVALTTVGLLRSSGGETERSRYCWDTLTEGDVASLSGSEKGRYQAADSPLDAGNSATCTVAVRGHAEAPQFTLTVDGRAGSSIADTSPAETPIGGGVDGWVNLSRSQVRLPDACVEKMGRTGNAVRVELATSSDVREGHGWDSEAVLPKVRSVLMKAATGLAEAHGCTTSGFAAPKSELRPLTKHAMPAQGACGLPGFIPVSENRDEQQAGRLDEYASGRDFRYWRCFLVSPDAAPGQEEAARFTVTTSSQEIGDFERASGDADNTHSELRSCEGKKTLLQMRIESDEATPEGKQLLPAEVLFERFTTAVAKQANCPSD